MGIEQDPECRWDVLRIIFGDGFRDMFLIFAKNGIFDVSYIFHPMQTKNSNPIYRGLHIRVLHLVLG